VLRWLVLLDFSDLMLDVLYGYLALYFVDVVGVTEGQAALGIAVWTGVGLLGDVLIIPLLERVRGLTYLRFSAAVNLLLFPTFLLIPGFTPKVIVLGILGVFNAGWYSVLQAQVYSAMPGQSGAAAALSSIFGVITGLLPLGIGVAAHLFTLENAMWLLLLGPIALLIGIPRRRQDAL
jgi:FSR family fosmidomycin resistance protein-like MFS transporter